MMVQAFLKKFSSGLMATALVLSISACASQLPGAQAEDDFFSLMSESSAVGGQLADEHQPGQRGRHGKKGHPGKMMMGFFKDLNLTPEQKAQFKTLMQDGQAMRKVYAPQMKASHEKIKAAFLADNFDVAALKAELQQNLPVNRAEIAGKMAEKLVAAWKILTPEQQSKLEAKLAEMETRMQQFQQKMADAPQKGKFAEKRLQHMAQQLGLSEAQQEQLKALWSQGKPDRQARMQQMKTLKTQVLAALKSGASSSEIAALITPMTEQMGSHLDKHLEHMAQLHKVLTPAQRQKFAEQMGQRHKKHEGRRQQRQQRRSQAPAS